LLVLNVPQLWRDDRWVDAPDWMEDSSLAAVTYPEDGGFNREVRADRLVFLNK
jgi:hypothetical protein